MQWSIHEEVSGIYLETLTTCLAYLVSSHTGETRKLLEREAERATMRLFAQEGQLSIDRMNREIDLRIRALHLRDQQKK